MVVWCGLHLSGRLAVVWCVEAVRRPADVCLLSFQLPDQDEAHYSCQLLFLLSAPMVLTRRAAVLAPPPALKRQNKISINTPAAVPQLLLSWMDYWSSGNRNKVTASMITRPGFL